MLKLGIIGTSPISHEFIKAVSLSHSYTLSAVYSRKLETAKTFAQSYENITLFTDVNKFFSSDLDVIYIASPNSLHFEQAKAALQAKKHVIVEKPMVSTLEELAILTKTAQEHNVFLLEAARNYHEKAFATIREFLDSQTILGGQFTYAKYSSKMKDLLAGKIPNIFSADFSGGALMDLGVYTLYAAVGLLGKPNASTYTAQQLPNSVDLNGTGVLTYPDFKVTIRPGKNISAFGGNEIYTADGTLVLDSCEWISSAIFHKHDGSTTELSIQAASHQMQEETLAFAQVIENQDWNLAQKWLSDAQVVHETLYSMRQDAGIIFKADTHVQ
ncbi:gfo/Idh/MocA family oxidoreductase [Streptococcus sp. X16XC17]|uniref:Gfo/Idh/MocA family protein n=1 Tax=unclassified Streptococcus TaxID=2608887 RepID=UPI00066FDC5F|nr:MULTISPECIES: Gfo/Idh/MocA family oxidoreductase [unclassified Streptococcus]TCD46138.1 gfo/Idh/MocA family oxidoreductase [Streptococcus sp. X16XC17]